MITPYKHNADERTRTLSIARICLLRLNDIRPVNLYEIYDQHDPYNRKWSKSGHGEKPSNTAPPSISLFKSIHKNISAPRVNLRANARGLPHITLTSCTAARIYRKRDGLSRFRAVPSQGRERFTCQENTVGVSSRSSSSA